MNLSTFSAYVAKLVSVRLQYAAAWSSRERQPAQRLRKRPRARLVAAPGAPVEKRDGISDRQHIERDLLRSLAPVREPGSNENPGASSGQETVNLLGRGHVIVDEEPDISLLCQPAQRPLGQLLEVRGQRLLPVFAGLDVKMVGEGPFRRDDFQFYRERG